MLMLQLLERKEEIPRTLLLNGILTETSQHALEEVENGDLDRWFKPEFKKPEIEFKIDDLDHPTRSNWLSAIVSPRPLTLISTRDGQKENIAPITSLSVVSNTPPLLIMSLSQTRDGTKRDTYHNLINSGECELQFLAPTIEAAKMLIWLERQQK